MQDNVASYEDGVALTHLDNGTNSDFHTSAQRATNGDVKLQFTVSDGTNFPDVHATLTKDEFIQWRDQFFGEIDDWN